MSTKRKLVWEGVIGPRLAAGSPFKGRAVMIAASSAPFSVVYEETDVDAMGLVRWVPAQDDNQDVIICHVMAAFAEISALKLEMQDLIEGVAKENIALKKEISDLRAAKQ